MIANESRTSVEVDVINNHDFVLNTATLDMVIRSRYQDPRLDLNLTCM